MRAQTACLAVLVLGGSIAGQAIACGEPEPAIEATFCCARDGDGGSAGAGGGSGGAETGGGGATPGEGGRGGAGGALTSTGGGAGGDGRGACSDAAFTDDAALTSPRSREQVVDVWSAPAELGCGSSPVVLFVHGGAWRTGTEAEGVGPLVARLAAEGVAVASVRYRLSPDPPDLAANDAVRHPAHVDDVTNAIGWLHAHADELGLDPERVIVVGREAGAHLGALAALDETRLASVGLDRSAVRCVAALEPRGLDLVGAIGTPDRDEDADAMNAFGPDPATWASASPLSYVTPGTRPPAFWIAAAASSAEADETARFADALRSAGGEVTRASSTGLSGAADAGPGIAEGDELADALVAFVAECTVD